MKLRGIEFGNVWGQSGVQGFFGEGYRFHKIGRWFGLDFAGVTFVAKTTTLLPRPGNMPLGADGITPKHWFPRCIVVKPWKGVVLNAVGLSGPGAAALFADGRWQARGEPFMISFMSVAPTIAERCEEFALFLALLKSHLPQFNAPVAVQLNVTCPNVDAHGEDIVAETRALLDVAERAGLPQVPIVVKLSVDVSPANGALIAQHSQCDAICVSNTVKWGKLPDRIPWKKLFGSDVSPLAKFGGGGLSGAPLLPLVIEWVSAASWVFNVTKPIVAGGGILHPRDVELLSQGTGACGIAIGSVAILRPWRLRAIIEQAGVPWGLIRLQHGRVNDLFLKEFFHHDH